jgi:hypothetical protein
MEELSTNTILQIIPVLFVLGILLVGFMRNQAARQQQAQGVLWLQAMRMLITHIQRHRGLSSGVLSGDSALRGDLEKMQVQVSRDFEQIGGVGEWIKGHGGWQSITQHWARLAGNLYRLPVERSIDQHTKLIKNILVLVDEIASQHYLGGSTHVGSNVWRDLLMLGELMGQVRAVGTLITATTEGKDDRVITNARKELQRLMQEILATLEAPRCQAGLDPELFQATLNFLTYVDTSVLSDGVMVSSPEYYRKVTEAIDAVYAQFDEELNSVNRRLMRSY